MLLAIDIGNSNTSVGLFGPDGELKFLASLDTDGRRTADQFSIDLMNVFALYHYDLKDVSGAIVCSVVPPLNFMMRSLPRSDKHLDSAVISAMVAIISINSLAAYRIDANTD